VLPVLRRSHSAPTIRRLARQLLVLLCCLGLTGYFAHHAVHGRHGLEARKKLVERASLLEFEIRSLEAVRGRLARDVALLAPDRPHPDIVEDMARDVLGFAHPADRILRLER
jgi:cell division protein FtsB